MPKAHTKTSVGNNKKQEAHAATNVNANSGSSSSSGGGDSVKKSASRVATPGTGESYSNKPLVETRIPPTGINYVAAGDVGQTIGKDNANFKTANGGEVQESGQKNNAHAEKLKERETPEGIDNIIDPKQLMNIGVATDSVKNKKEWNESLVEKHKYDNPHFPSHLPSQ